MPQHAIWFAPGGTAVSNRQRNASLHMNAMMETAMRPWIATALLAAACAAPDATEAQSYEDRIDAPAWVRIVGVAEDDLLNIRAEPNPSTEIVGTFIPDQGRIEVVEVREIDGQRWGMVSTGERAGWINLAYAEATEMVMIQNSPVPLGTVCAGTEPFWTMAFSPTEATWSSFETEGETYEITESESAASRPYPWMFAIEGFGLALFTPEYCSDGMSDLPYAWSALIVGHDESGHVLYEGCCRLETLEEPNE